MTLVTSINNPIFRLPRMARTNASVEASPRCWRYCLHVAYYGTDFVGWQRQQQEVKSSSGLDSVQEVVEAAVTETLRASQRVNVTGVSRTDAGTHALYVGAIKRWKRTILEVLAGQRTKGDV